MLNVSSRHLQISVAKKSLDSKWVTRRHGNPAWANFDSAPALNEFIMLDNVATQVEDKLEFDRIAMKILNNTQADALRRSEYRQDWSL